MYQQFKTNLEKLIADNKSDATCAEVIGYLEDALIDLEYAIEQSEEHKMDHAGSQYDAMQESVWNKAQAGVV